jgi:type IV pilus assembly protein PilP
MSRLVIAVFIALSSAALVVGCGEKGGTSSGLPPPPTQRGALGTTSDAGLPVVVKAPDFSENDFIENDHNRDPFRSFASLFVEKGTRAVKNQLPVILPQYSIDELKLVAIVTGGDYPRAMLLDPNGKGWVVHRGDYIGRPDTVHTGGTNGTDYQLNWRVDRVRDGDIVLSREDRASGAPPATRVIPLHPENEKNEGSGEGSDQQRL